MPGRIVIGLPPLPRFGEAISLEIVLATPSEYTGRISSHLSIWHLRRPALNDIEISCKKYKILLTKNSCIR